MADTAQREDGNPTDVNLTPMIDCTFQLIIFFIITAQISNDQLAPLLVPEPKQSVAVTPGEEGRSDVAIVNIFSRFGRDIEGRKENPGDTMTATGYKIKQDTLKPGEEIEIAHILAAERERFRHTHGDAAFFVEVRADRDLGYDQVLPVMRAAAHTGIDRMYMTAVTDPHFRGTAVD